MKKTIIALTICLLINGLSFAADDTKSTKALFEDIMALTNEAAQFLAENGRDGLPEFNQPTGRWVRGELYVFVYGLAGNDRGVIIAHPRPGLVGKNFLPVRDKNGKYFAAEFVSIAESEKGRGWSEYWWPKLENSSPEPKVSYIVKVKGQDMLVGVGAYTGHTRDDVLKMLGQ